jgi:phosphoribosyl 1,2-cyclic phosphodiesterase
MKITLHGCRGSIAVSSKEFIKYGGYTSCYELRAGNTQIILDTGTGFQNVSFQKDSKKVILFSHLHHDHIQGLGFNSEIRAVILSYRALFMSQQNSEVKFRRIFQVATFL